MYIASFCLENKETYYDKPIIEDGADDVALLKGLASKLSRNKETKPEPLNEKGEIFLRELFFNIVKHYTFI